MRRNAGDRWRSRRTFALAVSLGLAVLTGGPLGASAAQLGARPSTLIVPGESIGPARLGMTVAEAAAAMGPSKALNAHQVAYPRFAIVITFDAGGNAAVISTTTPRYRTMRDAGVTTPVGDAERLVGDINSVRETTGPDTTVWYAFKGIGFVFRGGRAVETFVVPSIPFGPAPPPAASAPAAPSTLTGMLQASSPSGTGAIVLRDVTVTVLPAGGFAVSGFIVNTGAAPAGPIVVVGAFTRASGDRTEARTIIPSPLNPGAAAPFSVQTGVIELALQSGVQADVVVGYQVAATTAAGAPLTATSPQAVPLTAYTEFARRQIHVRLDVGAPSAATGPPMVQVLVSVADTGTVPPQWIQQITVTVPYVAGGAAGAQTAELRPGQVVTVLVPAAAALGAPEVTDVVLGGQ
jgi:hypothetical protein